MITKGCSCCHYSVLFRNVLSWILGPPSLCHRYGKFVNHFRLIGHHDIRLVQGVYSIMSIQPAPWGFAAAQTVWTKLSLQWFSVKLCSNDWSLSQNKDSVWKERFCELGLCKVTAGVTAVTVNGQMNVTNVTFVLCKQRQTGNEHRLPVTMLDGRKRRKQNLHSHARIWYAQNSLFTCCAPPDVRIHLQIRKFALSWEVTAPEPQPSLCNVSFYYLSACF